MAYLQSISNKELNQLKEYIWRCCKRCGRKYPDTVLNIEGVIHHNRDFICIDKKECDKTRKNNLKNQGKK